MQLIHDDTASAVEPGTMLHMVSGPHVGEAWRFEKIIEHPADGHHVHVTRPGPKMGRMHRECHPAVFGCSITAEVTWRRHVWNTAHRAWSRTSDYLVAGAVALVPLAFYERFDWAHAITEVLAGR